MRALILAAGTGTRLRPHTDHQPKCLVQLGDRPLLQHQLDSLRSVGVEEVGIVTGYRADCLEPYGLKNFHNPEFETTNMVVSMFCARPFFDGKEPTIIAYGDIVYEPRILQALMDEPEEIAVSVDLEWETLWSFRMEDPLSDAETLKLTPDGFLKELGKKPQSPEEVEGQYMGLLKFGCEAQKRLMAAYDSLDREALYDGRTFPQMFMTSFVQNLIDSGWKFKASLIRGGWLEVDTSEELERYTQALEEGGLSFYSPT